MVSVSLSYDTTCNCSVQFLCSTVLASESLLCTKNTGLCACYNETQVLHNAECILPCHVGLITLNSKCQLLSFVALILFITLTSDLVLIFLLFLLIISIYRSHHRNRKAVVALRNFSKQQTAGTSVPSIG